jgi:DNA (cytosine-5)-methyltransferase 1
MIAATLFSGGGLADIGLKAAGYDPVWAIEYHQPAAEIYRANFNHDSLQDLLTADPRNYLSPDYLHLSSPCQSFSGANTSGGEKSNDLLLVKKCADFICWHQPPKLSIENVPNYSKSKSFETLTKVVNGIYPHITIDTVDVATFGVPQSRRRLFLRASFEPIQPLYLSQTHSATPDLFTKPLVGWWEAIHDLIDDFLVSEITDKELRSIEHHKPKPPFLIQRVGVYPGKFAQIREAHEPCWTIRACTGGDVRSGNRYRVIDVVTADGVCRSLNLRSIARIMGCPDTYQLPATSELHEIWRVLGNGVPPLAMQAIAESF